VVEGCGSGAGYTDDGTISIIKMLATPMPFRKPRILNAIHHLCVYAASIAVPTHSMAASA
jgi:hypothetical protein